MEAVLSSSRSRQVNIYFTPAVEDRRRTLSSHPPELVKKIYRIIRGLPHASAWESFRSLRGKVPSISSLARQPVKPPPMVNLNSIHNNQENFHTDYTVTVEPGCWRVILYSCQANKIETRRGRHWSAQIDDISYEYHPSDSAA